MGKGQFAINAFLVTKQNTKVRQQASDKLHPESVLEMSESGTGWCDLEFRAYSDSAGFTVGLEDL